MGPNITGLDCTLARVESLPPSCGIPLEDGGAFLHWFELLEGTAEVVLRTAIGAPAMMRTNGTHYIAGWPSPETYVTLIERLARAADIQTQRLRDTQTHRFWFNYAPSDIVFEGRSFKSADLVIDRF